MTSFWNIAKAVIEKKLSSSQQKPAPEDEGLPFGARVGSAVKFNAGPFLRAGGTLVGTPAPAAVVVAISRVRMNLEGQLYRFYLSKGDNAQDAETYVQVYADSSGKVQEMHYFERVLRMYPDTPEAVAAFTGQSKDGLGQMEFSLWRDQMKELGYSEDMLQQSFGDSTELVYTRMAGGASEYMAPFEAQENRIDDSLGKQGLHQKLLFMPYARELSNTSEQLVISTEILSDQNGTSVQDVHVDFMIGLPLSSSDVLIQ